MSNNPYEVPPAVNDGGAGGPNSQAMLSKVGPPAIGLIVVGALNVIFSLIGITTSSLIMAGVMTGNAAAQREQLADQMDPNDPGAQFAETMMNVSEVFEGPGGLASNLMSLVIAVVIISAGTKMKGLRSYGLALTGSILAMIPCLSNCCLVGLPIGIWALVVLMNAEVKQSFR